MLMQYMRDKFSQEGKQEAFSESLTVLLKAEFGSKGLKTLQRKIKGSPKQIVVKYLSDFSMSHYSNV